MTNEQIKRIQAANDAINRLEIARQGQHGEVYKNCSEAIRRWKLTIAFIEEEDTNNLSSNH